MARHCDRHRLSVRAGPLFVATLIGVHLSTPRLLAAAATVSPRSRWSAAPSGAGRVHDSASSTARYVAVGVRCGATTTTTITSSRTRDGGDDVLETAELSSASEGGLATLVKKVISNLIDAMRTLLGRPRGSVGGGSGDGKAQAKKASKSSKRGNKPSGGGGFTEAFEAKYGNRHPTFNEKSFADATEAAWARNRLCLVYIAADEGGGGGGGKAAKVDDAICKALADPEVAEFIDANFVMWVPGGGSSAKRSAAAAAAAAAKRVGARSLPFLGVVNSASETDKLTLERKLKRSTAAMHHCNPPPSASQMVSWMSRVLELKEGLLEIERAEQQRLKEEITIHTERVDGYSKSLKDDALREAREKEEEAERVRLREDERAAQEALEARAREDVERRARKADELGQEPSESALKGDGTAVSTLMLRLGDGSRVRRRFLREDPMGKVLAWADVHGVDLGTQRLSSTLPKASFSWPRDSGVTIEEAGLGRQALLFVEQIPSEAAAPVTTGEKGAAVAAGATAPAAAECENSGEGEL